MSSLNKFEYFTDIETAFVRRRGKHLLIGPVDWALIESWKKRGIPLRTVLSAIDEVFDGILKKGGDTRDVGSLKYCETAVERRFSQYSKASVGKHADSESAPLEESHDDFSERAIEMAEQLGLVLADLPEGIRLSIENCRNELLSEKAPDAEFFDRLDSEIDASILAPGAVEDADLIELAASEAAKFGSMENDGKGIYERFLLKAYREKHAIPTLSVYQL
ncbi:MAG: hypothetical protein R2684_05015 [Pyrinomonadaceae bacterium]